MGLVTLKNIRKEEIMKKHTNFLRTILVCALVVCALAAFGISSLAEDAADASTLSIKRSNVAYSAETQLLIELNGTATEGRTAGIAYWDIGEDTTAAPTYNFNPETFQGVTFYRTEGISAQNMSAEFYVCAAERDENGVCYLVGTPKLYGIYSYVKDRLDDEGVSEKQMSLYKNLVLYGNSAELAGVGKDTAEGATVRRPIILLDGGHSIDNGRTLAFADENGNAIIRANTVNADGEYFCYWETPSGDKDYNRITTATADSTKNNVYTAVYDAKDDSAYAVGINFGSYATGELNVVTSSTIKSSGNVYYTAGETYHLNNLVHAKGFVQVTSAEDSTIIAQDTLAIKENDGAKYLSFNKNVIISGVTAPFIKLMNPASTKTQNRVELELALTTPSTEWLSATINLYTTGGDSSFKYTFERDGRFIVNGVLAGMFERGEKINITIDIVDGGFDIYVNGAYVSTKTATLTSGACFNGVCPMSDSGVHFDIDVYTVNFVDTDKFD